MARKKREDVLWRLRDIASEFLRDARRIIEKLMDISDDIEELLDNYPRVSITNKKKRIRVNDTEYLYDYVEVSFGDKTYYFPISRTIELREISKMADIMKKLSKILRIIYTL